MFNDATFLGWLTTGAYVATSATSGFACQSVFASNNAGSKAIRRQAWFWLAIAVAMLLLAVNKQLDLQTAMTELLRDSAIRHGWYENRRLMQVMFVFVFIVGAAASVWLVHRVLGRHWRENRLVLAGCVILLIQLAIRVADIERVGEMIGVALDSAMLRAGLEWIGLVAIGIAGWRTSTRQRRFDVLP